jgi:hypothetical protein
MAADNRQGATIQVKMRTIARIVCHNIQSDRNSVKMSGSGHVFRSKTDNSNVNVHRCFPSENENPARSVKGPCQRREASIKRKHLGEGGTQVFATI